MKTLGRLGQGTQWRSLGALLRGMIIAPLILGTPFFSAVAQETSTGATVLNTQCDVSLKPFSTGSLACTPVTGFLSTDTQCSGSIRQYPAQYGCVRAAQGIRCMKITFPPRYIEYSASGAVSGKSTLQILMCLGLDQGLFGCLTEALVAIGGVILVGTLAPTPAAGVAAYTIRMLVNVNIVATLSDCALTAYNCIFNNACCFFECRPGMGQPLGERPWC